MELLQHHALENSYETLNAKFPTIDLFDQSKITFKSSGRLSSRQNIKWILKLDSQDVIENAPPKPDEIAITDPLRGYFRDIKFINELLIEEGTNIEEQAFNQKDVEEPSKLETVIFVPNSDQEHQETVLRKGCFARNLNLNKIVIQPGVRNPIRLLDFCFSFTGVTRLDFSGSNKIQLEGKRLFSHCINLIEVKLHPHQTGLTEDMFSNCDKLKNIDLSEITQIDDYCFYNCPKLKAIKLPKIENLGSFVFADCIELENVELNEGLELLNEQTFLRCDNLVTINLENIKRIKACCFFQCEKLKNINLSKIEILEPFAFARCGDLTSVILNKELDILPAGCFKECTKLENININELDELTIIQNRCFRKCHKLCNFGGVENSLTLEDVQIETSVFRECNQIVNVEIIKADNYLISPFMFHRCGLKRILLPDRIDVIIDHAFSYMNNLNHIIIPPGTTLSPTCFENCHNLRYIFLPNDITIQAATRTDIFGVIHVEKNVIFYDVFDSLENAILVLNNVGILNCRRYFEWKHNTTEDGKDVILRAEIPPGIVATPTVLENCRFITVFELQGPDGNPTKISFEDRVKLSDIKDIVKNDTREKIRTGVISDSDTDIDNTLFTLDDEIINQMILQARKPDKTRVRILYSKPTDNPGLIREDILIKNIFDPEFDGPMAYCFAVPGVHLNA